MFTPTAELSPWIRVQETAAPYFDNTKSNALETADRNPAPYTVPYAVFETRQSFCNPEYPGAQWLDAVEQRIVASVLPPGYKLENDGTWLSQQVANAAVSFFGKVSNAFAVEPYLYSSPSGDLVAEFDEGAGRMTCVISHDSVTVFAMRDGELIAEKHLRNDWSAVRLLPVLNQVLTTPPENQNGALER